MKTIPTEFKLGAQTIDVSWNPDLLNDQVTGKASYHVNKIFLVPNTPIFSISKERQEQVFWHEVVHWIMFQLGKDELREDEEFVDLLADKIMQIVNTMEGDLYKQTSDKRKS